MCLCTHLSVVGTCVHACRCCVCVACAHLYVVGLDDCAGTCVRVPMCVLCAVHGRGSFSAASRRAVSTELIVRGEARERLGREATGLINKSSVLSLRTQPAGGLDELELSARGVGLPANTCRHPLSCPSGRES